MIAIVKVLCDISMKLGGTLQDEQCMHCADLSSALLDIWHWFQSEIGKGVAAQQPGKHDVGIRRPTFRYHA